MSKSLLPVDQMVPGAKFELFRGVNGCNLAVVDDGDAIA